MPDRNGPHLPDPWGQLTLQSLMIQAAATSPARVFLRDCPDREGWNGMEPRVLTYDAFFKGVSFLAAQLKTLGIERGDHVLLLLPNLVELPLSILACHLVGAIPAIAPIDEKIDALRGAAERCQAAAILTTGMVGEFALGDRARQVAAKVMTVRCVAGFGFRLPEGIISLEGWSEEDIVDLPEIERQQGEIGLVTFARVGGRLCAVTRTEGQMIAEALAVSSVLRLDGRRGLISLMQPGAAASVAASLTLPLHAGASVRLIGPYDTATLARAFDAEPTAFLYCPDHFAAQLTIESLGSERLHNHAGILALTRAETPHSAIMPPGVLTSSLIVDFHEAGIMTALNWPQTGRLDLPDRFPHPMESVLPEGENLLEWLENTDGGPAWGGFGAASILTADAIASGKAA